MDSSHKTILCYGYTITKEMGNITLPEDGSLELITHNYNDDMVLVVAIRESVREINCATPKKPKWESTVKPEWQSQLKHFFDQAGIDFNTPCWLICTHNPL
jgi:hypothetical protein